MPASTARPGSARLRARPTRALGRPWLLAALVFAMAFGLYRVPVVVGSVGDIRVRAKAVWPPAALCVVSVA